MKNLRRKIRLAKSLGVELVYQYRRLFKKPPRIVVFYLYADRQKYPHSHNNVEKLLRYIGAVTLISIDNFRVADQKKNRSFNRYVFDIAGDNSFWEFSGWRKGVNFCLSEFGDCDFDVALFINDAFLNSSAFGRDLRYFKNLFNVLTLACAQSGVLGQIDVSDNKHILCGYDVSSFVRSNIFAMPYGLACDLKFSYFSEDDISMLIPNTYNYGKITMPVNFMNENFRIFLEDWLTNRWQGKVQLEPKNWPIFRGKLTAILNERMLSAECRQKGYPLLTGSHSSIISGHTKISTFRNP